VIAESILCIALNVYFEARSEDFLGKIAVGSVVMNRIESSSFPDNACDVVYQAEYVGQWPKRHRCQFSWFCDGLADIPRETEEWAEAVTIATWVHGIGLPDITDGALWYHSNDVSPEWATTDYTQIGSHKFYTKVK
jgi:spore germination cell wall hydrolase CwlJ-like protein